MNGIIFAGVVVGVIGIIVAVLLGIAAEAFKVEVDERVTLVRAELPGNNCGGCGYAGCDGLAAAIVAGEAKVDQCPVGGAPVGAKIAGILGVEAGASEPNVAFVKCAGTCDKAGTKYNYYGMNDCTKAVMNPGGGAKVCSYGCLGLGSCVAACDFDAIHIVNGVAVVDADACKGCGKCSRTCPKKLIDMIPMSAMKLSRVQCASKDKGKTVKEACDAGCIGCGVCQKQCDQDAITVVDNCAIVDYSKCNACGKCVAKCPRKIIQLVK